MDEVDLDYYLAHRTPATARDDRGPSIRVEPFPDAITRNDCKRHGLLLFVGTTLEFLQHCDSLLPNRPTPYELIPEESQKLIPKGVSKLSALSFLSDFELVPSTEQQLRHASPFFYGQSAMAGPSIGLRCFATIDATLVSDVEKRIKPESNEPKVLLAVEKKPEQAKQRPCADVHLNPLNAGFAFYIAQL